MRSTLKNVLSIVVLTLGLTTAAVAGPVEEAAAAYRRGDYQTALRILRPLADQGIAGAQFNLGVIYQNGQGVPRDYAEAAKWYRKAADNGDREAQNNLAVMYVKGTGVQQSYHEAMKWFRKAADRGSSEAQINLGRAYAKGLGVPKDYVRAYMWFSLAARSIRRAITLLEAVAAVMTPAQIAEARKLAQEWKPKKER